MKWYSSKSLCIHVCERMTGGTQIFGIESISATVETSFVASKRRVGRKKRVTGCRRRYERRSNSNSNFIVVVTFSNTRVCMYVHIMYV